MTKELTKPQPPVQKVMRKVKYEFADRELQELGLKLAGHVASKRAHENEKKEVVAGYTAKIAGEVAKIDEVQNKLTSGFEIREVPLIPHIDWDAKRKNFLDEEGNVKDWESLTSLDYQHQLALDNELAGDQTLTGSTGLGDGYSETGGTSGHAGPEGKKTRTKKDVNAEKEKDADLMD